MNKVFFAVLLFSGIPVVNSCQAFTESAPQEAFSENDIDGKENTDAYDEGEEFKIPAKFKNEFETWMLAYEEQQQNLNANQQCTAIKHKNMQDQLLVMANEDQSVRLGKQSNDLSKMNAVDRKNTSKAKQLISEHGWPRKCDLSKEGMEALWLIIQHTPDDEFRTSGFQWVKTMHAENIIDGMLFAMSYDRNLMEQKLPQLYGTQTFCDKEKGEWVLFEVKDANNLNRRRNSMGLMPIEVELGIQNYPQQNDCR